MLFNLQNENEVLKFDDKCDYLKSKGKTADLIEKKNTRTTKQNSALHLLYSIMCNHLNELGLEYDWKTHICAFISPRIHRKACE